MTVTISNWLTVVFMIAILVLTGIAEYIHIAPSGTFYTVLLLTLGISVPSPIAHPANPAAQQTSVKETTTETRNG